MVAGALWEARSAGRLPQPQSVGRQPLAAASPPAMPSGGPGTRLSPTAQSQASRVGIGMPTYGTEGRASPNEALAKSVGRQPLAAASPPAMQSGGPGPRPSLTDQGRASIVGIGMPTYGAPPASAPPPEPNRAPVGRAATPCRRKPSGDAKRRARHPALAYSPEPGIESRHWDADLRGSPSLSPAA